MQSPSNNEVSANRSRPRALTLWVGGTLLIIAVGYVLRTFHWSELVDVLGEMDVLLFLGAGGATIIVYWLLRTTRWLLLISVASVRVSFKELYLSTAISLGFAIVTPLQSGEAGKVEWLIRSGKLDRSAGYSAYALERLLDLVVVCTLALIGLGGRAWSTSVVPLLLAGVGVIAVGLIVVTRTVRFQNRFADFIAGFGRLATDSVMLVKAVSLTIASWLVVAVGWHVCLASLSIELNAGDSITLVSLITIANILSFVPGAWGISEIGIAQFLGAVGHEPLAAQAGALILRGYGLLTLVIATLHLLAASALPALGARRTNRADER